MQEALKPLFNRHLELSIEDGCIIWGIRVVIPKSLQTVMLKELHEDHPGVKRMKALARGHFWWPKLDQDIEQLATSCHSCQAVKQAPPVAPMHPWTWPTKPWQRVHIDFAGPLQDKMYFLVIDAHSKWPEVFEMSKTTTNKTITVLRHLFAKYGIPQQCQIMDRNLFRRNSQTSCEVMA